MENSICGEQYANDIYFNSDGIIEATRFRFQHAPLTEQKVFVNALIQTKVTTEKYENKFSLIKGKNNNWQFQGQYYNIAKAFPYSLFYVYYDQYTFIRGVCLENILIALASIFLAVQLLMNIKAALIVIIFYIKIILGYYFCFILCI
jgi:Niemann-Pick C1 protein